MKSNLFKALLIGAATLSGVASFVSCNNADLDALENRVTVLELTVDQLKADLEKAVVTGETITSATEKGGVWTLVLSSGQTITINPASAGGSSVTVTESDSAVVITVDGKEYILPKGGSTGVQLVYSPEYADGIVALGMDGAEVRFLASAPIDLASASFDVAEAHEVKTRLGSELFMVKDPSMDGDFLVLTLKGLGCEAGKTYAASVVANIGGAKVISNYFTVAVDENFVDDSEQIGGCTIKPEYNPTEADALGFCSATVPGDALVAGMNLKDMFSEIPAGATIQLAKVGQQPGGKAQERYEYLEEALAADGTFAWKRAPRTDYNEGEQHGFLVKVVADDIVKAKVYVIIDNPLANGDIDWFPGFKGQFEAEWHSRTTPLEMGVQEIDLAYQFNLDNERVYMGDGDGESVNPDYDVNLIFGGKEFFTAYTNLVVTLPGDETKVILENNGENIVPGEYGAKFLVADNDGLGWYNRALNVDYQECPEELVWDNEERSTFTDRGAIGIDWWWGDCWNNIRNADNERNALVQYYGLYIDKNGVLHTGENYCGFAMRLGIGLYFDYAYGCKNLKPDQMGLMFINRRRQPEGFRNPVKANFGL